MIDYKISKNARILFVGINPHPGSYRRGVPFSNNKMFWYLLNRAGLLQESEKDLKNDQLLKGIYDVKVSARIRAEFCESRGSATIDVTERKKGEEQAGVRRALRIIRTYRPKVICFIGKIAFNTFYLTAANAIGAGRRGSAARVVYLMHFPIRGPASVRVEELKELKRASRA